MNLAPIPIHCDECGSDIDCPVRIERIPVAPVGEARYRLHLDPTPYWDHLDGPEAP
jgi:hypothetical protein